MKKNDVYTAVIDNIGSNSEGIAKVDGIVCFIPFALVGEKVSFKVLKVQKNIAFCKLIEVLTPSEIRVRPKCEYFTKCGGCALQHVKITEQHKIKTNLIKDCFKKIAGLDVEVSPFQKCDEIFNYRNKIQLPIRNTETGVKIGFFHEKTHRVVDIEECVIEKPIFKDLIKAIREFVEESKISVFSDETNLGLLKHVVAREIKGKLLIIVVVNGDTFSEFELFKNTLSKYFKDFSIVLNINKLNNNVILGKTFKVLYGQGYYFTEDLGIKYPVFPESFMQVNDTIKNKLYSDVSKLFTDENEVVIDAYSGMGVMSAMLSKNAKKVIGVEIVQDAVKSANELVKLNNLTDKMVNICAPCEDVIPSIIETEKSNGNNISIVLDPPRKGCDNKVLESIIKSKPNKIVYVACSPQSLARDIGILLGALKWEGNELKKTGTISSEYEITKIVPYDMFPQTKHVETLVCLTRNN